MACRGFGLGPLASIGRGGRKCDGMFGSGINAVATGASVMMNSGPKSARSRDMRRVAVFRGTSSSMSRSMPLSLWREIMA